MRDWVTAPDSELETVKELISLMTLLDKTMLSNKHCKPPFSEQFSNVFSETRDLPATKHVANKAVLVNVST
jgi:hypothetical protein